jgi:hypothetical protein
MEENNGGKTGYYDLPLPDREVIEYLIRADLKLSAETNLERVANKIIALLPQTLNDLIEFKQMQPWQHEVFKATYALNERALKNPKKGSSKLREVNKILYYANRGKNIILNEEKNTGLVSYSDKVEEATQFGFDTTDLQEQLLPLKNKPHIKIKIQSPLTKQEEENGWTNC